MTATTDMAAIETVGLTKTYDGKVEALRGIDLEVKRGEMFALLGPNGAGKTTLFSILATLRKPSGGEARVLGLDVLQERSAIRQRMGIVFQEPALEQRMSVRDNLLLMALFYGLSLDHRPPARRWRSSRPCNSSDIEGRQAQKLSGGQKRKLELARSLVSNPDILFLDEATLGLDVDARRNFWAQVRKFVRPGARVFFTTHYMEEAEVADRIALIDTGRIIALGTPKELKNRIGGGVILLGTEDDAKARDWLTDKGYKPETERTRHRGGARGTGGGAAASAGGDAGEDPARGSARAEPGRRVPDPHRPGPRHRRSRQTAPLRHGRCPMRGLLAVIILDLKRLWVDRIRLISSLIQPLLYLFVLGSGLGASSTLGSGSYLPYIFPGVVALSLLFTSVFAAILIVFDRQMGFLKAVLVAPVPRPAIAIGKVSQAPSRRWCRPPSC